MLNIIMDPLYLILLAVFSSCLMRFEVTGQSLACSMPSVHVHSTNPTNVTLRWSQPFCSETITHYVVLYRQSGCCARSSRNIDINERSFTATSLVPNTTYHFQVALANTAGVWSSRSINTTTSHFIQVPSTPILDMPDLQPNYIQLTWTQPSQDFVEHYEIQYWRIFFCASAPSGNRTISGSVRTYNLTGLEENIRYNLTIRAINSLYHSQYSTVQFTTPATLPRCCTPTPQIQSTSESSVTITWEREHCLLRNGQPVEYVLQYGLLRSTMTSNISGIYARSAGRYTVRSLDSNAWYRFQVALRNEVGLGPFSPAVTAFTESVTNSANTSNRCVPTPKASSITSITITITWATEECGAGNGVYSIRHRISGSNIIITTQNVSISNGMYTATLLTPGTQYEFEVALVNVTGLGPYTSIKMTTSKVVEAKFFLKGLFYFNNSLVLIDDIGSSGNALICLTPYTTCCDSANSSIAQGDWFLPDGNRINSRHATTETFSRTRGASSVLLHKEGNMAALVGIFTCRIPFNVTAYLDIFIGIYPSNQGSPVISSLTYDKVIGVLTCESTGGPATTVTWNRMGNVYQQSQTIVNTSTATYHNYLHINSSHLMDYYGEFVCSIQNTRGTDTANITANIPALLSNNQTSYQQGSSADVSCTSFYHILSIQWINSSNNEVLASTSDDVLMLHIKNISSYNHRTTYTCVLDFLLPSGASSRNSNNFTITTTPGVVEGVIASSPDDDTLVLKWTTPAFFEQDNLTYTLSILPVTSVVANYLSSTRNMAEEIHTQNTTAFVTKLNEGVPYNICITARNSAGKGEKICSIYFTRDLEPRRVPQNITATWSSLTGIKVTWTPLTPYEARGHVISYTIFYTSMTSGVMKQVTHNVESKDMTTVIELEALQESSSYLVQMWASTIAGPGPISPAIVIPSQSSGALSAGVISAITGSTVVVFILLVFVAAIIIVIIVIKYKYSVRTSQQKEDNQTVELTKMKTQQDLGITTSKDGTEELQKSSNDQQSDDSHHYANINCKNKDGKPLKGITSTPDSEAYCNSYEDRSRGYYPLKPIAVKEISCYETVHRT